MINFSVQNKTVWSILSSPHNLILVFQDESLHLNMYQRFRIWLNFTYTFISGIFIKEQSIFLFFLNFHYFFDSIQPISLPKIIVMPGFVVKSRLRLRLYADNRWASLWHDSKLN